MNNFPKSEKLCGQLRIKALYSDGTRFVAWPLRVTYKPLTAPKALNSEALSAPKVLIWAPKSLFKHAVDRNRMRRVMREAYRLLVKEGAMPEKTEWIFIARSAIGGKKVGDVEAEMRWMVGKSRSTSC